MSGNDGSNLAVLIDGDNVSSKVIAGLMAEVANHGTASVRRIYGDWTSPQMTSWRNCLLEYSIAPIQQFAYVKPIGRSFSAETTRLPCRGIEIETASRALQCLRQWQTLLLIDGYTRGKNATDGAMIIDAMDLLYTGRFSTFCIVSSDSDFTHLASRIREQGTTVYGFGKRNTKNAFVAACNKFVYFDALPMVQAQPERTEVEDQLTHSLPATSATTKGRASAKLDQANPHARDSPPDAQVESSPRLIDEITLHVITAALTNCPAHEDDWVELGQLGKMLVRISPDMIPRNYGYSRLRDFVEASGLVDWQAKPKSGGGRRCSSGSSYFVRLKEPDTTTPDTQALSVEETISQPSIRRQRDAAIPDAQDLSVSKTKGRTSKHKRRDATETNPHERRSQPVEKAEARRTKRKRRDSTEAGVQERDDLALSVKQIEARPVKRKRRHE